MTEEEKKSGRGEREEMRYTGKGTETRRAGIREKEQ
jgi:hypothetical protein